MQGQHALSNEDLPDGFIKVYPLSPDDIAWDGKHIRGAFRKAASMMANTLSTKHGVKNKELAKHLLGLLRQCRYDVFSRIEPNEIKARYAKNLVFVVWAVEEERVVVEQAVVDDKEQTLLDGEEQALVNGKEQAFAVVKEPRGSIVLPYSGALRAFYIPVSDNTLVAVNFLEKKIVPHGKEAKGVVEALKSDGKKGRVVRLLAREELRTEEDKAEMAEGLEEMQKPGRQAFVRQIHRRLKPPGSRAA